jgi:hypothetical protein
MYGGVVVQLRTFLSSDLRFGPLIPWKQPLVGYSHEVGTCVLWSGYLDSLVAKGGLPPSAGIEPRTNSFISVPN